MVAHGFQKGHPTLHGYKLGRKHERDGGGVTASAGGTAGFTPKGVVGRTPIGWMCAAVSKVL